MPDHIAEGAVHSEPCDQREGLDSLAGMLDLTTMVTQLRSGVVVVHGQRGPAFGVLLGCFLPAPWLTRGDNTARTQQRRNATNNLSWLVP